jgi:hypothetical protein
MASQKGLTTLLKMRDGFLISSNSSTQQGWTILERSYKMGHLIIRLALASSAAQIRHKTPKLISKTLKRKQSMEASICIESLLKNRQRRWPEIR